MLDFVKAHLSTILLTSLTFVLTLIYLAEVKWQIMMVWGLFTLFNIVRLAFAYKKNN
ncbi:MAG: cytochrome O ubiquinol oxidase [Streptococcus lutetiensis]|nr:cytochrome O ubiquinol oxidase [Streptococcus lutetiensis]MDU2623153.1 cytochrome O ubiquinol oxidase [Streptococcus lutetiensis]MDU2675070.1 cytochrome O ubiquinol oxidase [Streptococcus lutetiensis]